MTEEVLQPNVLVKSFILYIRIPRVVYKSAKLTMRLVTFLLVMKYFLQNAMFLHLEVILTGLLTTFNISRINDIKIYHIS